MGKNLENLKEVTEKQYELRKKQIDKNIEIVQEAEHKYEEDIKVVEEFVELLADNVKLVEIKLQTGCSPLKFKVEDTTSTYIARYGKGVWHYNEDITFDITREDIDSNGYRRENILGVINLKRRTYEARNLKEFVKVINVYKELILEDLAKSSKEYLS